MYDLCTYGGKTNTGGNDEIQSRREDGEILNRLIYFSIIHAEECQKLWEKTLGITKEEIEKVIINPDQIVPGDGEVLIVQSKRGNGLLRVPFINERNVIKVLTVYWTSKVEKYWKEETK